MAPCLLPRSPPRLLAGLLAGGLFLVPPAIPEAEAHPRQASRTRPAPPVAMRAKPPPAPRPAPPAAAPVAERTLAGLRQAAALSGAPAALLLAIAAVESSLDPLARNRRSSARGLMQFTHDTWLEAVRDHGPRHGLGQLAAQLRTDRDGRVSARDPRLLRRVLALRDDPRLSALLAAERLQAARGMLETALDRPPAPVDLYLVHLLGPVGAIRFLEAHRRRPSAPVSAAVAPAVAAANAALFLDEDRPLTLAASHARIRGRLEARLAEHAPLLARIAPRPVELAEAP